MDAAYPHLEGQIFEGKRFLVKMDSFIQHTPVSNHISCVPEMKRHLISGAFSHYVRMLFRKKVEQINDAKMNRIFLNRLRKKNFLSRHNNGIDTAPGGMGAWRFNIPILRFFCF